MPQSKSTGLFALMLALCLVTAAAAHAELLLEVEGVELYGTARLVYPGSGTCNVLESDTSYEARKGNHGTPMDVWRLDFSVRNGTGHWLDHLIARYRIASKWPECTNWTGPDPLEVSDLAATAPHWAGSAGFIQRSERNGVAPGALLAETQYIIVLRDDPVPRFSNSSVDFWLGSASAAEADAESDPRTAEAVLGLDRATRRLLQEKLLTAGFDPGVADGLFGPVTRAAIRLWQAARGMAVTGYLDSAALEQLWTIVAEARRDVSPQPAPEVDAERQTALRTTLRRMARALVREGGPNRVAGDAPRRDAPETASPPRANLEERPAVPVRRRPPERRRPAEAPAPEERVSTPPASTGFCGLSEDDPAYIVVGGQTPTGRRRGWGPQWTHCPNGPANGCSPAPGQDFADASRYVAGLGGESHCDFEIRAGQVTLNFRVYRFDSAERSRRPELAWWYDMARGAHGWVADHFGDVVGGIDLADWPKSSRGR